MNPLYDELLIEEMIEENLQSVAEIENLCFSSPWSYNALSSELDNPLAVYFVVKLAENVVGYAGMHHVLDEGYIANIAVHPGFRKKGFATALLNKLQDFAQKTVLAMLTLEVRATNQTAISIYHNFGFEKVGLRHNFYDNPREDGIIMTKFLKHQNETDVLP